MVNQFYLHQQVKHKMELNFEQLNHCLKSTLFIIHKQLQHTHQHKFLSIYYFQLVLINI